MSNSTHSGAPEASEGASWATESLPLVVRKELLERELRQLGIRKAGAMQQQQQQQPQGHGSHPQADSEGGEHAD